MYALLKPWLFSQNPETIHDRTIAALSFVAQSQPLLGMLALFAQERDPRLQTTCFGLRFPNPIGLAAGLDKNAAALPAWPALGFGFLEIGSVTARAQLGNDKPRLFRLPEDAALLNRMGFNNVGADAVAQRLRTWTKTHGDLGVPLGVNLGKSKVTPLEDAPEDYLYSLQRLYAHGDYFVLNVSSPNTPGLRELQDKDKLQALLGAVLGFRDAQTQRKPVVLKIAPDLTWSQLDEVLDLVTAHHLDGLIATNTTTSREGLRHDPNEMGGLSGVPLAARSLEVLRYVCQNAPGLDVVSVGGIFTLQDVLERLEAGAKLVQLYTSLVFEGPMLPSRLCRGLLAHLS